MTTPKLALIIEDDQTSILVLQHLLDDVSVDSIVIIDGLRIAEELDVVDIPDVIFIDLEMPVSNGYTVLDYIQNNSKFENIPTVAYTTHISHLNDARLAGFHSFLGKPVDGDLFAEQLDDILNGVPVWHVP